LELQDSQNLWSIEEFLFPAKITDGAIPSFIVPIKPRWAHNLFDEKLANQTIFGTQKTQLALNREAVYYKSKRGAKKLKPGVTGRILWYVSQDKDRGYTGVSAIRACSRLDEVIIGKPRDLYRLFRNLGIYEWSDIFKLTNNDENQEIMALRFSDTELFKRPVPLKQIQQILKNNSTMQSPRFIPPNTFAIIYKLGHEL